MPTTAHRRAIDRVHAEQAGTNRMMKVGVASVGIAYDEVVDDPND